MKLCDFSYAGHVNNEKIFDNFVGTELSMAPEIIKKSVKYDLFKAEVFSTGVLLFNMVTGLPPFPY